MKPILFSTPMVQAILEGKKMKTRRIIKPQPDPEGDAPGHVPRALGNEDDWGKWYWDTAEGERILKFCPFGFVGDILWVREMFFNNGDEVVYRANGTCCEQFEQCECNEVGKPKWKPSIFMPKEACRMFLKIKSVRVERLQDITNNDALAEGIQSFTKDNISFKYGLDGWTWSYTMDVKGRPTMEDKAWKAFANLWGQINGPDSWNANPWVWVIEFERCDQPENFLK